MFDFAQIIDLMKVEPGHGLTQTILLFMIWLQSRGLKKAISSLELSLTNNKIETDNRFLKVENRFEKNESRINALEQQRKV